jgi:DNA polymerase III epsilon subunit-like protein
VILPEIYFSVDIEASGPIPGEYSMLSLGACRIDSPKKTFYAEIRPINDNFVPAAIKVSGFDLRELARTGREPRKAMSDFGVWIERQTGVATPVFVGFNASFDWSFVNWYFHKFVGSNPFGFGALDIKAYYMGLSGCEWEDTRSSKLPPTLTSGSKDRPRHNALSDAVYQAGIFRRMMESRSK